MNSPDGSGPDPLQRALVLSGSIGKGHDVVAEACAVALGRSGCASDVIDCMALLGTSAGRIGRGVFETLITLPGVYDAFHFTQLRPGSRVARAMDGAAARQLAGPLVQLLDDSEASLVLSVFPTGAAAVNRLKAHKRDVMSVVYCTDACPHRLWVHPHTDLFLVTSEMSAAFVRYHRPSAPVAVVPAAARPVFYSPPSKAEARMSLGIPQDADCALVMGGSWGMAPVDHLASAMAARGLYVIGVAGNNQRLHQRLTAVATRDRRVLAYGFSDAIPEFMAAADVVVTTAGDTCTESRIVGRPLLLLDTVPGHGRENLQLELARGGAAATSSNPSIAADAAVAVIAAHRDAAPGGEAPETIGAWEQAFLSALAMTGFRSDGRR